MGKTVKMSFEGKSQQEIGKWIDYSEKKKSPGAASAPALGLNTIFQHFIVVQLVDWLVTMITYCIVKAQQGLAVESYWRRDSVKYRI